MGELMEMEMEMEIENHNAQEQIVRLIRIEEGLKTIRADISDLKSAQRTGFVTAERHHSDMEALRARIYPLERVIYGVVGLTLLTVFGALLALVIIS